MRCHTIPIDIFDTQKRLLPLIIAIFVLGACLVTACATADARTSRITRAESTYRHARAGYNRLVSSPRLRTDRRAWIHLINRLRKVYLVYPNDRYVAPKTIFMMGRCYRELYGYSGNKRDINNAIGRYQVLLERFPKSRLADDALYALAEIYRHEGKTQLAQVALQRILRDYSRGNKARMARRALKRLGPKPHKKASPLHYGRERGSKKYHPLHRVNIVPGARPALVQEIRHWSAPDYTRIVIDTTGPVSLKKGYLRANRAKGLPKRLYLDLSPAYKKKGLRDNIPIRDGFLRGIRIAQFRHHTVRVVFDLGETRKTRTFWLEDPFRIVVDAFGKGYSRKASCPSPKIHKKIIPNKAGKLSLAQQLGLCVRRVVIDPGHGGKDPGATGPTGLREKDVVLKIAKKVDLLLKKEVGCQVILTRSTDRFLPLTQRTAIANARKADLFISIHANASPDRRVHGVETYFLNFALDKEAMRVAARENAASTKRIGNLRGILNKIMKNTKVDESSRLANYIETGVVSNLRKRYRGVKKLGVKQAPFFVLIGARMPSVLIETSFISNKKEERRLRDNRYLNQIAQGIVNGIESYMNSTKPTYSAGL
ncbi:MAG: AMIN domain-containing protein [Nitrospiraceae bacterium]|nr:AMIN domain-containing protein [Nitrospiraceae bacterium]